MFDLKVDEFQEWLFTIDIQNAYFVEIYNNNRWGFISESNLNINQTTPTIYSESLAFQEFMQQKDKFPVRVVQISRYLANGKLVITKVLKHNIK